MAMQGRAGPALAIAAIGSFIAGTFSVVMLQLMGATVAGYSLRFGPPEFFSLMVFGLCTVASLTGTSVIKSIITTCLGLMIATVGIDLVSGAARFTFGNPFLQDGDRLHRRGHRHVRDHRGHLNRPGGPGGQARRDRQSRRASGSL